jgi:type II secretory ATPase GspE/PulE/Tfp pilus assembly ATPase PilB-like protein
MLRRTKKQEEPQIYLPPVNLTGGGASGPEKQANLITARQSPAFPLAVELIAHAMLQRAEVILLDYTREAVAVRYQVDGLWHNMQPRDRESGDAMLQVLKKLADLNINERRARQEGKFGAELGKDRFNCTLLSQGTKTGERVLLKIVNKKSKFSSLEELGMRDKMRDQLRDLLNGHHGFVIMSAPPGNGLTTLWNIALNASDRFVRDFVSVQDKAFDEEEVININPQCFNSAEGQSPDTILPGLILRQMEVFVVPDLVNGETVGLLCGQVIDEQRMVITRVVAKDAVEALLRVLMLKGPAKEFAEVVTAVLNVRLIRKLCENCRQAYPPAPALLQKLGIPPGRVQQLYREYQPPPPEQLVDEKGRPIVPPICPKCGGVGYFGRTGIFELLVVNDELRQALVKQPTLEVLRQVSRKAGHRGLQEEGILLVARGVTSLTELQRVLKQ